MKRLLTFFCLFLVVSLVLLSFAATIPADAPSGIFLTSIDGFQPPLAKQAVPALKQFFSRPAAAKDVNFDGNRVSIRYPKHGVLIIVSKRLFDEQQAYFKQYQAVHGKEVPIPSL
jgi:hypothetical protein